MTSRITRCRVVSPSLRSRSDSSVTLAPPGELPGVASGAVRLPRGAPRLAAAGFGDVGCVCRGTGSAPWVGQCCRPIGPTLAGSGVDLKHLFEQHAERIWILSEAGGTSSYRRSIERSFETRVPP